MQTDEAQPLKALWGILPDRPEAALLRDLIALGCDTVGADEGSLLIYNESANDLRFAMTFGDAESERALLGQRVPLGAGVTGLAAATKEVQIGAPVFKDIAQAELREGSPKAVIAAPLLLGTILIGVITAVSFKADKRFSMADAKAYARVARIAATIVDQRRRMDLAADADGAHPGEAFTSERAILESLRKIVTERPDALGSILSIVRSLEAMTTGSLSAARLQR